MVIGVMGGSASNTSLTGEETVSLALQLKKTVSSSSAHAAEEPMGFGNAEGILSNMNETDAHTSKLFGSNYARLQQVKKVYDPDMVWSKWFAIKPAA